MRPSPLRRLWPVLLLVAAVACTGEAEVPLSGAEVTRGSVVQTVAAAGTLQPVARVAVTAPAAGLLEELWVGDGDRVAAGDPLFTVRSEGLEGQLAQARAAVAAADELAGVGAQVSAIPDLSPVLGGLRSQLDAVIPPVLGALEDQVAGLAATLAAVREATEASGQATAAALQDLADRLGGALPDELGVDPDRLQVPDPQEVLVPVDTSALESSLAQARRRLETAQREYRDASAGLAGAERDLAAQAEQVAAAQQRATAVQRDQAETAVAALQERLDELAVVAPAAGVVELSRGQAGAAPDLSGLLGQSGGLADALGGAVGGLDVGELTAGGSAATVTGGPPDPGSRVAAGQQVLTVFDLSAFTVEVEVDELDVVEVAVGQPVRVLVDALPELELSGTVTRVGIEPRQLGAGGALYPVSVALDELPGEVELRVGLTASVEIEVREVADALVVPTSALLRRGGDEVVHVVRDGIATRVGVELLALGDGTAAVRGALEPGEVVVTLGVELVEDGQAVEVELDRDPGGGSP